MAFLRRVLLALGRRLHQQGVLDEVDDIFFLEIGEVERMTGNGAAFGIRERIKPRLEEYQRNLESHSRFVVDKGKTLERLKAKAAKYNSSR